MTIKTAVIGVGHLGKQHARIHAALADEGLTDFNFVCDVNETTAREIGSERNVEWTRDWRELIGKVDAVSLVVPTESHAQIACGLLENGIHVLVEKPISRTLVEADDMIRAAEARHFQERDISSVLILHSSRYALTSVILSISKSIVSESLPRDRWTSTWSST